MYLKTGDTIVVISGRDKHTTDKKGNKVQTTGRVIKILPNSNKVIVEGVNLKTNFVSPKSEDAKGEIVRKEAPIHVSNVAILDPKTKKATKIGYQIIDGQKVRVTKKSGTVIDEVDKKKKKGDKK